MMFDLDNVAFRVKIPNSVQIAIIYHVESKQKLLLLLDVLQTVRVFYNGKDVYVWKADMLDHKTVRSYIDKADCYIGFMIDKREIVPSIEAIKSPLLDMFKIDFMKNELTVQPFLKT